MDVLSLRDRLAVVIGGTGGIGGEIAAADRRAGARVVIAGRRRGLNRERMPPARKEEAVRRCAMGRMGELPELVDAAIFLASDASAFVDGETLRVDGGHLASGI